MRKILFVCIVSFCALSANEFIQKRRSRHVSLNKLKEHAADALSAQLRLSAKLMQHIGNVQVKLFSSQYIVSKELHTTLNGAGTQLRNYSLQLPDVLTQQCFTQALHFNEKVPIAQLLGHITYILGVVQQYVIKHLEDIFEDKGAVFIKKHRLQLPDVIKNIKLYTKQFHALQHALSVLDQKMSVSRVDTTKNSVTDDNTRVKHACKRREKG